MTSESMQIAEVVDGYPEWVRKRMRDAMERIAVAYGMTVAKTSRAAPPAEPLPANVLPFRRRAP